MAIFDADKSKSWDEKLFLHDETFNGKTLHGQLDKRYSFHTVSTFSKTSLKVFSHSVSNLRTLSLLCPFICRKRFQPTTFPPPSFPRL